ncbi:hypothetical protein [Nocardiopsis sp. JB363]|uniref:hypothetical protein n=1 Tax=Nocardiopsis sp. JB363 TaxID=1434837 RepID=UPI00097AB7CA|nr:hypothetical protein [Nocardiopsis sp. JB363]SIO85941.1 hypothetical protein BQ8420_09490 [Nocardiopsis sp. JB363]
MPPAPAHREPPTEAPTRGVLVGVDLRGIQAYVYSGRRILDAVGRAALVAELTDTSDLRHGVADLVPEGCLVLRDAGGALTVVLSDVDTARTFTARYTRRLRDRAGDLTPVVAFVPYGPGAPRVDGEGAEPDLDSALTMLPVRLRRARRHMSALHAPAHGYGITAVCSVSGAPAESVDSSRSNHTRAHERVSADVARARGIGRRWHRAHGDAWLADAVTATGSPELALPMEVDRLGRDHGGVSRVAVMHLDVNGLGAILGEYRERAGDPDRPGSGALAQRGLSTRIAGLTGGLARAMVRAVAAMVRAAPGETPHVPGTGSGGPITLDHEPGGPVRLPVRPIVVAGDDLTVLCDARLALAMVRYALRWLDTDPDLIEDVDDPRVALHRTLAAAYGVGGRRVPERGHTTFVPTVGVGVAMQPVGAPLSLGYDLCEAMCRIAKTHRVARAEHDPVAAEDHTVAWTTRFDGVERVLRRMEDARRATPPRTARPMSGTDFTRFLDRYLGGRDGGPLVDGDTRRRGWLVSSLVPLLESGVDPAPELARRARVTGRPVALPQGWTTGELLDAVDVMDLYLDPGGEGS